MRFVVFECRKCGYNLYAENTEDIVPKVGRISNTDCPFCGEEPDGNWVLVGLARKSPEEEITEVTDERNLKPCPFCGGKVNLWQTLGADRPWHILCGCGGRVGWFVTEKEAITAWNRRTTDEQAD